jgi:hypothetical protein
VETFDMPAVRAIAAAAATDGYKMSSFILGVVRSDAFQRRHVDPAVSTDAPQDASKQ